MQPEAWKDALTAVQQRAGLVEMSETTHATREQAGPTFRVRFLSVDDNGLVVELPEDSERFQMRGVSVTLVAVAAERCWVLTTAVINVLKFRMGPNQFVEALELAPPHKVESTQKLTHVRVNTEGLSLEAAILAPIAPKPRVVEDDYQDEDEDDDDGVALEACGESSGLDNVVLERMDAQPSAATAPAAPAAVASPVARPDAPAKAVLALGDAQRTYDPIPAEILNVGTGGVGLKVAADQCGQIPHFIRCTIPLPGCDLPLEVAARVARLQRMQGANYLGLVFEFANDGEQAGALDQINQFVAWVNQQPGRGG